METAEDARIDGVEDRPQLAQPVLDGRAGERDLLVGAKLTDSSCRFGVRVLHHLGLVEDDGGPVDRTEVFEVTGQQPVGRDDHLELGVDEEHLVGC